MSNAICQSHFSFQTTVFDDRTELQWLMERVGSVVDDPQVGIAEFVLHLHSTRVWTSVLSVEVTLNWRFFPRDPPEPILFFFSFQNLFFPESWRATRQWR